MTCLEIETRLLEILGEIAAAERRRLEEERILKGCLAGLARAR